MINLFSFYCLYLVKRKEIKESNCKILIQILPAKFNLVICLITLNTFSKKQNHSN